MGFRCLFFSGWLNTRLTDRSGLRVGWACLESDESAKVFTSVKKKKKVRAPLGIAFFSLFNAAFAGSHSELCAETVTPRKIQWIFAISLCDGLGWLAAAGSIGFYFARLLGCLSCLPA